MHHKTTQHATIQNSTVYSIMTQTSQNTKKGITTHNKQNIIA